MWRWRRWGSDDFAEDIVKVSGEIVSSGVDVDGGFQSFDVYSFMDPPFDPVML